MKRRIIFILLALYVAVNSIYAQNAMRYDYDLGVVNSAYNYSHTDNTTYHTDDYGDEPGNDIIYKIRLMSTMDLVISHCGSAVEETVILLSNETGDLIASSYYDSQGNCPNSYQAYLKKEKLYTGVYYIVSKAANGFNGMLTTSINLSFPPVQTVHLEDLGTKSTSFAYTDTRNTVNHTNTYVGKSTNDLTYKFTLSTPMKVIISHCGSAVPDTYLSLLDASKNLITYNDNYYGEGACSNSNQAYLQAYLKAGTYYAVSEGNSQNGNITTKIQGTVNTPVQYDLGTRNTSFTYAHTQNTANTTDYYPGSGSNDVMYKFTLGIPMNITISHCGSTLQSTKAYLLDASETLITESGYYNGEKTCTNASQAYLACLQLPAGTYYAVSEGYNQNGSITTTIEGSIPFADLQASSNRNYTLAISPTKAWENIADLALEESMQKILYYDDLGRPIETVLRGHSPGKADLVNFQEYDALGKASNTWLPVITTSGNKGAFVSLSGISSAASSTYSGETKPYSRPVYEASPLNRIHAQYGPGQAWQNNGKAVYTGYLTNKAKTGTSLSIADSLVCAFYLLTTDDRQTTGLKRTENYPGYSLSVTRVTDEDGNTSYEFRNKLGQTVLTRQIEGSSLHDTYYVYDSYGNLRVVLPPLAADNLLSGTWDEHNSALQQYAYLYKYDGRNRCIAKKLPGAEWIYYVYDNADQLIFTQDGAQRARGEWSFNIPDKLGRTALSGVCTNSLNNVPALGTTVSAAWVNATNTYKGYTINGITLSGEKILAVNYYDQYDFMGKNDVPASTDSDFEYETVPGYGTRATNGIYQGLQTGVLTALLNDAGTVTYLPAVMYYDNRGRMVQSKSRNHLAAGVEKEYILYTFTGQLKQRKHIHSATGKTVQTEFYTYTYDHAERLTKVEHQLQAGSTLNSKITLAEYAYDELGRQQTKRQHGSTVNPITYAYNIRGWLTGITNSKFTQNLYYNTGNGVHKWNGNISSMTWKAGDESTIRGYKFAYDGLNRLTDAIYGEEASISTNPNRFTEKIMGYDKHGNITGLQRHGKISSSGHGLIDNLSFGYVGNQMKYVNDAVTSNPVGQSFQFVNGSSSTGDEYTYDANGNMSKDLNKNITDIQYNLLNLPKKLQLSSGGVATYTYDAAGVKRKVEHQGAGENKTTDYCGNVVYENGALSKILTDEGYITLSGTTPTYHYYLKGHLGNNRVVLNQNGSTVEQVNHYYPFGGLFDQTSETLQAYKFGGKELDRTYGIDLYDYSARFMDGAVGRFTTMDPHAENYYAWSPYHYAGNNPINITDPTGMDWYWDKDKTRQFDPNITSQDQLKEGQTYIGATDAVKDKNGNITEDYRDDGSIMFSNEASGYQRMVSNSLKTGNEEMGVITDKGVLVVPNYKNSSGEVDLKDYRYSVKNGNIVDAKGMEFNTIATVHTHPNGSGPSTYAYDTYGDLEFAASATPYKPVYVLQMNGKNAVSFIYAAPGATKTGQYFTHNITAETSRYNMRNLQNGQFSLRKFTDMANFRISLPK